MNVVVAFVALTAAGVLQAIAPLNIGRAAHTATTLPNGQVLIVGGFAGDEREMAGVELFDPEQRAFQSVENAATPRQSHTATLLPDGRVLIAGGYDSQGRVLATAEIFDPRTRRFAAAGRMSVPRGDHVAVSLSNGRIALIGGLGTDWTFLDSVELYDPTGGAFSEAGHLSVPRTGHVAVRLRDGRILIAGGHTGRRERLVVYDSAEIFDARSGHSRKASSMQVPRHKHDAVLLADGRVLVTGGADARDGRGKYDSAEIYDPVRDRFTSVATMGKPRYKHRGASVLLPNGTVLIAGGASQPELYDPATDTFTLLETPSPLDGYFQAVTRLRDQRVLITGGYSRPDAGTSNGAWLYAFGAR